MNTADQKFSTVSEFITARDAMPAGPDQSKEWAKIAKRFASAEQAEKFTIALRKFIAEIEARKAQYGFERNYSPEIACDHVQIEVGNTGGFVRIVLQHRDFNGNVTGQRMSHSFVSMANSAATKSLCAREVGDVFKCATYKAPATHVRGNIFADAGCEALTADAHIRYL